MKKVKITKKKNKKKASSGITLVALVITIIVLLILAAITLNLFLGQDGIIKQTSDAAEEMKISQYEDSLTVIGSGIRPSKIVERWDNETFFNKYQEKIHDEDIFKGASTEVLSDGATLRVITDEGYVFEVQEKNIKYIGKRTDDDIPPELTEEEIKVAVVPSTWTNQNVEVTFTSTNDYEMLYSENNGKTWKRYYDNTPIVRTENGTIFTKIEDKLAHASVKYATTTISNIDKKNPIGTAAKTAITSKTITVNVTATEGTDESGISEIIWYCKKIKDPDVKEEKDVGKVTKKVKHYRDQHVTEAGEKHINEEQTLEGLTTGKYIVYAVIKDVAGNEVVVGSKGKLEGKTLEDAEEGNIDPEEDEVEEIETDIIPDLHVKDDENPDGNVTFQNSPNGWTNGHVIVKVTLDEDVQEEVTEKGYTLQYSIDNGATWTNYNKETGIEITENKDIQVKLTDGLNNSGVANSEVKRIDTEPPTGNAESTGETSNSIEVEVNAEDKGESTSGIGDITVYYRRNAENEDGEDERFTTKRVECHASPSTDAGNPKEDRTINLEGLVSGIYDIYIVVTDVAGNEVVIGANGVIAGATSDELKSGTIKPEHKSPIEVTTDTVPNLTEDEHDVNQQNLKTTFSYNPSYWTNTNVIVKIDTTNKNDYYRLQYATETLDNWTDYTDAGVDVASNMAVYARLFDGVNASSQYATGNVTKIDKQNPSGTAKQIKVTSRSITVEVKAEDQKGDSGISKVVWYCKEPGENGKVTTKEHVFQQLNSPEAGMQSETMSQEFDGLTTGTYLIYAVITDVAGNEAVVGKSGVLEGVTVEQAKKGQIPDNKKGEVEEVTTVAVPALTGGTDESGNKVEGNTTFTFSPDHWTNTSVNVTIKTDANNAGYTLQYKTDKEEVTTWTDYPDSGITIKENNTVISARLWDGVNEGQNVTAKVTKIDKIAPEGNVNEKMHTSNSITVTVEATDKGGSGIANITVYYKKDNESKYNKQQVHCHDTPSTEAGEPTKNEDIILEQLQSGTYDVYVVIKDVAGSETVIGESGKIEGLTSEKIEQGTIPPGANPKKLKTDKVPDLTTNSEEVVENQKLKTTFNYNPNHWTNGTVTVAITTTNNNNYYRLQYSFSPDNGWTDYKDSEKVKVNANKAIYVRLYDGVNAGIYAVGNVENIDTTEPTGKLSYEITTKSISATVTAEDGANESGISNITWYCKPSSGAVKTSGAKQYHQLNTTDRGKAKEEQKYTFEGLETGTYIIYAVIQDVAGNKIVVNKDGKIASASPDDAPNGNIGGTSVTTPSVPTLDTNNTTISWTPTTWTNQPVSVTINTNVNKLNCTLQYRLEKDTNWTNYSSSFNVSANTKVYARLSDDVNDGNSIFKEIENIDTQKPSGTFKTSVTTKTITVTVNANDSGGSGLSTIVWHCKTSDGKTDTPHTETLHASHTSTSGENSKEKVYTFENLKTGTYNIYAVITDVAGNSVVINASGEISGKKPTDTDIVGTKVPTTSIPALASSDITYSPQSWTKGNVAVTITHNSVANVPAGCSLQYKIDSGSWGTYNEVLKIEKNCTVYARLSDGLNGGTETSATITKIDKLPPNNISFSDKSSTSNSITIKAAATDAAPADGSGQSGISKLYYSYKKNNEPNWIDIAEPKENGSIVTISGLVQTTGYKIKVKAVDSATNEYTLEYSDTITTGTVPTSATNPGTDKTKVKTTFEYSPTGWTNESVSVTIKTENTNQSYKLQYSVGNTTSWTSYSKPVSVASNSAIYARLFDGTNGGGYATGNVNKIDKNKPSGRTKNTATTTKSITVQVTATDGNGESGIAKVKWYCKPASGEIKTNETTYVNVGNETAGSESQTPSYTFDNLPAGTYTTYAVITDVAGNSVVVNSSGVINGATPQQADNGSVTGDTVIPPTVPDLTPANTTFNYSPATNWANTDVIVTINVTPSNLIPAGCKIEYSTNGGSQWQEYNSSSKVTVQTDNTTVKARITDKVNHGGDTSSKAIRIDRLQPSTIAFSDISHTSNSIRIKATATDAIATSGSGNSGIKELHYYYQKSGENTWTEYANGTQNNGTTITFTGLTQTKGYTVKVKAVDNAGNSKEETYGQTITTDTVTKLTTSDTKFTYDPTGWTNGKVKVTIAVTDSVKNGYILQYQKNSNGTWQEYTTPVEVTENNTAINARLWDGTNGGGIATGNVTKIDKTEPTGSITHTETTKSIKITVNANDNGGSGISNITLYCKKPDGTTVASSSKDYTTKGSATAGHPSETYPYTFNDLTTGTYNIYAVITDVAGNVANTASTSVTTTAIPSLSSNTTITWTPTEWTNGNVTITIDNSSITIPQGCRLQYQLGSGSWTDYNASARPTVKVNTTVNARLYDDVNEGGKATKQITNIDTTKPTGTAKSTAKTSKSITVQAVTNDTGNSGIASIVWYCKKKNTNDAPQTQTQTYVTRPNATAGAASKTESKTFGNLTSGTYVIYAVATDVAGNQNVLGKSGVITSKTVTQAANGEVTGTDGAEEVTTTTMPGLIEQGKANANTTFSYNPDYWTNGKVKVSINTTANNASYTLQYSTDAKKWNTYSAAVEVSANTAIYARLWDGVNAGGTATGNVTKIDTTNPTGSVSMKSTTTKSITVTVSASDTGKSGIAKIECYYKTGNTKSDVQKKEYKTVKGSVAGADSNSQEFTFSELAAGTYSFYADITDVAGNKITTAVASIATTSIPTLTNTNTTISGSPTNWTNGNVTITITTNSTVTVPAGCSIQYRVGSSGVWTAYNGSSKPSISANNTIYARLYDGKNGGTGNASKAITNIDKIKPGGSIKSTSATTKSITMTVNATDSASGVKSIKFYCKDKATGKVIQTHEWKN